MTSWRIAVIDDDAQMRNMVASRLAREFPTLHIEILGDEQTLEQSLEQAGLTAVVTDYDLGWTDGMAVLQRVKQRWPCCPVIMFTGSGSESVAVEAMKAGLHDYVLKGARQIPYLLAAVHSALDRARAHRAQMEAEARYQGLFERVPVGLYRTTPDGDIREANPALAEMLGYGTQADLLTMNANDLFVDPGECERWQALMVRDRVVHHVETLWRRCGGELLWVELSARAILSHEDQVIWHEGAAMDITERKRHQREMEVTVYLGDLLRAASTPAEVIAAASGCTRQLGARGSALLLAEGDSGKQQVGWAEGVLAPPQDALLSIANSYLKDGITSGQSQAHHEHLLPGGDGHALICAPLIAEGRAMGALFVGEFDHPSGDEARLLNVIAGMTANALYRAYLHQQTTALLQQLENRERFISRVMESIPSSLVVLDRSLHIVSINRNLVDKGRRTAEGVLGCRLSDLFSKTLLDYTRIDDKARAVFQSGKALEGGKVAYRTPGVPTRIYYYRLVPVKAGDAIENVMLFMDDITEREQLGQEVRQAERHLAGVVECANDMVISLDPQGRILTWNRAAERITGLTTDRVKGETLVALCAEEHRHTVQKMLRTVAAGSRVHSAEVELILASGGADARQVPVALSCSSMSNDEGRVVGIVGVGRDLTERHRLQAQLIHSAKMASLGVMAGGIAHELRNPLGIILVATQLIEESLDNLPMMEECIEKVKTASHRASLVIESLLKFARPQTQQMKDIELDRLLDETLALIHNQIVLRKIELVREPNNKHLTVWGNPDLLQQVFTNLVLNACNAMPQGGKLTITTKPSGADSVEIRFEDSGCGIPPENLNRIFDPFFTTMPVGKGTGLGLAISYSIIQQHRGTVGVASQVGRGTRLDVILPKRRPVESERVVQEES